MSYLGFCPPGVVFPYTGATAPDGWLLCNGSAVNRTTYASLFAVIGTSHGAVDGTTFNVPDYRGRFLRGTDLGAARDPNRATRTASGTSGNTGDAVGTLQAEATKKNGLTVSGGTASLTGAVSGGTASLTGSVGGGTASLTGTTTFASSGHNHNTPYGTGGGGESYLKAAWGTGEITSANANGASVGSTGSFGPILHALTSGNRSDASVGISSSGAGNGTLAVSNTAAGNGTLAVSNTAASIGNGDSETRPININVNYIIKI